MLAPAETSGAPSPGSEEAADADAETKTDRAANKEARTRRGVHDERVVGWDDDKGRTYRFNFNVRSTGHDDLLIGAQVAVVTRLSAHALDGVHDILALRQNGVAQIVGPIQVRGHFAKYVRKRKQRLNARIPGKLVVRDGLREFLACEVVMLIGPASGIRN